MTTALWLIVGLAGVLLVAFAAIETGVALYHTFEPIFRMAGS